MRSLSSTHPGGTCRKRRCSRKWSKSVCLKAEVVLLEWIVRDLKASVRKTEVAAHPCCAVHALLPLNFGCLHCMAPHLSGGRAHAA